MRAAEFNHLRIAAQHEAWMQAEFDRCVNTSFDEPPTHEPTYAEMVQQEARGALAHLELWCVRRLETPDYHALCTRAFAALYTGDPARAKALGRAKQAAQNALWDMAQDDVRTLAQGAERAVWDALRGEQVTESLVLEGV